MERAPRRPRAAPRPTWEALTDPAELHRWWGDTELDLVEGGRFALRWRNTDEHGNAATLDGAITKLDPPRSLEITADCVDGEACTTYEASKNCSVCAADSCASDDALCKL